MRDATIRVNFRGFRETGSLIVLLFAVELIFLSPATAL